MDCIGWYIKRHRIMLGLTQQELADKIHCNVAMICGYENEKRKPGLATCRKLADVFGVKVSELTNLL